MASGNSIIIHKSDAPSKAQLLHAVTRLRKDAELLKKMPGSKKTEDPVALNAIANFLEMLVKKEGNTLVGSLDNDYIYKGLLEMAVEHLSKLSDDDIAAQIASARQLDGQS